jgi:predicted neuraminidase
MYVRGWATCKVKYRHSLDLGHTWGPEVILRNEMGWMTRNKPTVLRSGRTLLPLYDEIVGLSLFGRSDDNGATWQFGRVQSSQPGNIQPSVVQLEDGSLLAIMRNGGRGFLWQARSTDEGETWTKPEAMALRNPNSAADMVRLPNGHLVLAFNDSSERRTPLSLALSEDEGRTWSHIRPLETDEGEFSYPAIICEAGGLIHATYTYRRTHIKHVECNEEWIRATA